MNAQRAPKSRSSSSFGNDPDFVSVRAIVSVMGIFRQLSIRPEAVRGFTTFDGTRTLFENPPWKFGFDGVALSPWGRALSPRNRFAMSQTGRDECRLGPIFKSKKGGTT